MQLGLIVLTRDTERGLRTQNLPGGARCKSSTQFASN